MGGRRSNIFNIVNTILESDFVEDYHPFTSWIDSLPAWDGKTDYIRQFFSMAHCKDTSEEDFHFYTRCWFVEMVTSAIDAKVVNHQILTFIGPQGTYKSSFMLHILPPHLRTYYTTKNNFYQITRDETSCSPRTSSYRLRKSTRWLPRR